jgi:hypothetical protein
MGFDWGRSLANHAFDYDKEGKVMYHGVAGFGALVYLPGRGWIQSDSQEYSDYSAAQGAALQASINAGNPNAASTLANPILGMKKLATQQEQTVQAQNDLTYSVADVNRSTASVNRATAEVAIPAQAAATQSIVPVNTQAAISQAAQTYKDVQGGGIAAQTYTALPYLIGGAVVLGVTGWILYAYRGKPKRRKK